MSYLTRPEGSLRYLPVTTFTLKHISNKLNVERKRLKHFKTRLVTCKIPAVISWTGISTEHTIGCGLVSKVVRMMCSGGEAETLAAFMYSHHNKNNNSVLPCRGVTRESSSAGCFLCSVSGGLCCMLWPVMAVWLRFELPMDGFPVFCLRLHAHAEFASENHSSRNTPAGVESLMKLWYTVLACFAWRSLVFPAAPVNVGLEASFLSV